MSFPSFEDTNSPGYDEAFNKPQGDKSFLRLFKSIGKEQVQKNKDKNLNSHIYNSEFHLVFEAINNGAVLTQKQDKAFTEKLILQIYNNFGLFEHTLTYGKQETIPDIYLIKAMFHASHSFGFDIYSYLISEEYSKNYPCKFPLTKNLYEEKLNDNGFKRQVFEYWSGLLKDAINHNITYSGDESNKFYLLPHNFYEKVIEKPVMMLKELLFETATREEYLDILVTLRKYPKTFKGIPSSLVAYVNQESPWLHARNLPYTIEKNNYFYGSKKLVQKNMVEEISLTNKELMLPKDSQVILNNIQNIFKDLYKDYSLLTHEDQFTVKNIYENRLPELINNFSEIKHEYRDNINSITDKNANELLNESLKNIEDMVIIVLDNLNQTKIINLSTSQKYISAIKNKMR